MSGHPKISGTATYPVLVLVGLGEGGVCTADLYDSLQDLQLVAEPLGVSSPEPDPADLYRATTTRYAAHPAYFDVVSLPDYVLEHDPVSAGMRFVLRPEVREGVEGVCHAAGEGVAVNLARKFYPNLVTAAVDHQGRATAAHDFVEETFADVQALPQTTERLQQALQAFAVSQPWPIDEVCAFGRDAWRFGDGSAIIICEDAWAYGVHSDHTPNVDLVRLATGRLYQPPSVRSPTGYATPPAPWADSQALRVIQADLLCEQTQWPSLSKWPQL